MSQDSLTIEYNVYALIDKTVYMKGIIVISSGWGFCLLIERI